MAVGLITRPGIAPGPMAELLAHAACAYRFEETRPEISEEAMAGVASIVARQRLKAGAYLLRPESGPPLMLQLIETPLGVLPLLPVIYRGDLPRGGGQ